MRGGHRELCAISPRRVQQTVGLVKFYVGRYPDQRIMLGRGGRSQRIWVGLRDDIRLGALKPDPGGQVWAETPLQPDQSNPATAVVGDRRVVDDLCARQEILVAGQEIGLSKIGPYAGDLLPVFGRHP